VSQSPNGRSAAARPAKYAGATRERAGPRAKSVIPPCASSPAGGKEGHISIRRHRHGPSDDPSSPCGAGPRANQVSPRRANPRRAACYRFELEYAGWQACLGRLPQGRATAYESPAGPRGTGRPQRPPVPPRARPRQDHPIRIRQPPRQLGRPERNDQPRHARPPSRVSQPSSTRKQHGVPNGDGVPNGGVPNGNQKTVWCPQWGVSPMGFDLSSVFWLRHRLAASDCIGNARIACFAVLASLVLTDEARRHLKLSLL